MPIIEPNSSGLLIDGRYYRPLTLHELFAYKSEQELGHLHLWGRPVYEINGVLYWDVTLERKPR